MTQRRAIPRGKTGTRELRVDGFARFDLGRPERTGAPEVILADGKSPSQLVGLLRAIRAQGRGAIVSRTNPTQRKAIQAARIRVSRPSQGGILILPGPLGPIARYGVVALLTAGTSDNRIAEEARAVLNAAGVRVAVAYDVGVAGLHRLLRALRSLRRLRPAIYLVCAGREGALPTVVAGLVRAPVIGIPTSIGYGRGAKGEAALSAMLQSCAPIAVVNIDGGVPAALFALQLLAANEDRGPRAGRQNP